MGTEHESNGATEPHVRQLIAIARLMLGAAHADGDIAWAERSAIGKTLTEFVGQSELPDAVRDAVDAFDITTFDLRKPCADLILRTSRDRKELLALIARVTDADAVLTRPERAYLGGIARAIGATEAELQEFVEPD